MILEIVGNLNNVFLAAEISIIGDVFGKDLSLPKLNICCFGYVPGVTKMPVSKPPFFSRYPLGGTVWKMLTPDPKSVICKKMSIDVYNTFVYSVIYM